VHCPAEVHALPFATLPHDPATHGAPTQSLSEVQVVAHLRFPLAHLYGAQVTGVAGLQVPLPSQNEPLVDWFWVESHDPDPQLVVLGQLAQCPWPSQLPFKPQLVMALAWQAGCGDGAVIPCGMLVQWPFSVPRLHCSQLPVQVPSQQTPSTQ
jgi:hypothetical protein